MCFPILFVFFPLAPQVLREEKDFNFLATRFGEGIILFFFPSHFSTYLPFGLAKLGNASNERKGKKTVMLKKRKYYIRVTKLF